MEIQISQKREKFLKEILGVEDLQKVVQKHIEDWIACIVQTTYEKQRPKTTDEIINELNKK